DQPRARAEERPPLGVELGQRGHEAPVGHQLQQRRRLTARNDEAVEVGELSRLPDLDGHDRLSERTRRVHTRERLRVRLEIALEREDADFHVLAVGAAYQPRVWRRSFSASLEVSIPAMASPRSWLTSASTLGSRKCVVARTMASARADGSVDLKMPEPTNTASAPSCIISAASAGVAIPPAEKFGTGSLPCFA